MNDSDKENKANPVVRCACGGVACIVVSGLGIEARVCHACFNDTVRTMLEAGVRFQAYTIE